MVPVLLGNFQIEYSYFTFLRWSVFVVGTYFGFAFILKRAYISFSIAAAIALLFNPIAKITLSPSLWHPIDILVAVLCVICAVSLSENVSAQDPNESASQADPTRYCRRVDAPVVYVGRPGEFEFKDWDEPAAIPEPWMQLKLHRAGELYELGQYEEAVGIYLALRETAPGTEITSWPFIEKSVNVIGRRLLPGDIPRWRQASRWWASRIGSWRVWHDFFRGETPPFIRCKYCGRYIAYISPFDAFRKCEYCHRQYPTPSTYWDSLLGQAQIYTDHSVADSTFYHDFERQFDVRQWFDRR